jgi:hypothetical protein
MTMWTQQDCQGWKNDRYFSSHQQSRGFIWYDHEYIRHTIPDVPYQFIPLPLPPTPRANGNVVRLLAQLLFSQWLFIADQHN